MGKIIFKILVLPLLYFLSILPFFILYTISTVLYVLIYYVVGYRKEVVFTNLRKAFPDMSEAEIRTNAKKFYLHFCDVFFETLKILTISKKQLKKRLVMDETSQALFMKFQNRNQSVVGVMGHCGNWEWGALGRQLYCEGMLTGVYHPLHNKAMDEFMLRLRGRFGSDLVAMSGLYKRLLILRQQNIATTVGLIADQTPPPESAYWTKFLNQDTGVFNGTEKLARKFNYPVLYMGVKKLKRGHYALQVDVLTENPKELPEGAISELHTRKLEENIREQPHTWLWSHRRWKHKRPANL